MAQHFRERIDITAALNHKGGERVPEHVDVEVQARGRNDALDEPLQA